MGHTNSTPNYALPQFITTDKPAWLTDINGAFTAIDTGLDAAKDAADNAQGDATQALTDAGNAATAAATADAKGAGALASIESVFDASAIYSVGAKVIYNNLLYRCTVAVVTPGPWTGAANWERITVDGLIDTNTAAIAVNASDISSLQSANIATNYDISIGTLGDAIRLVKYGKAVQITLQALASIPSGVFTTLGTAPVGYRPHIQTFEDFRDTSGRRLRLRIDTDGKINVYNYDSAITSTNNTFHTFTYIAAN